MKGEVEKGLYLEEERRVVVEEKECEEGVRRVIGEGFLG